MRAFPSGLECELITPCPAAVFQAGSPLDTASPTYVAGVTALVTLYERVKAGVKEDIDVLAKNANTLITTLCSSFHRWVCVCGGVVVVVRERRLDTYRYR